MRAIRSFQYAACFKCFVSLNLSDIGSVFRYLCFNSLCRDLVETFKIIDQTKKRPCNTVFGERDLQIKVFIRLVRGGSRIFFRRGCTRLLLYFNTNKPHSFFFFLQYTSCIRKPQVISGGVRTPCTLPLDPPLLVFMRLMSDTGTTLESRGRWLKASH